MKVQGGRNGIGYEVEPQGVRMLTASTGAANARAGAGASDFGGIPKTSDACARYEEIDWQGEALRAILNSEQEPMNTDGLRRHLTQIGCVPETIEFVLACTANAPVRKMKGHGGSVRHEVYSQKMGRTHIFESRTVELPFGMFLERDPDVLAYIPQPCEMPLKIGDGVGSNRIIHTPDVLIVGLTMVSFEEWKS